MSHQNDAGEAEDGLLIAISSSNSSDLGEVVSYIDSIDTYGREYYEAVRHNNTKLWKGRKAENLRK